MRLCVLKLSQQQLKYTNLQLLQVLLGCVLAQKMPVKLRSNDPKQLVQESYDQIAERYLEWSQQDAHNGGLRHA